MFFLPFSENVIICIQCRAISSSKRHTLTTKLWLWTLREKFETTRSKVLTDVSCRGWVMKKICCFRKEKTEKIKLFARWKIVFKCLRSNLNFSSHRLINVLTSFNIFITKHNFSLLHTFFINSKFLKWFSTMNHCWNFQIKI